MKTGIELIAAERERQIAVEGYTLEHDKSYTTDKDKRGESLAYAAVCYATPRFSREVSRPTDQECDYSKPPLMWPWDETYWKPSPDNRIKELIKAGALIAAEIDRLQFH